PLFLSLDFSPHDEEKRRPVLSPTQLKLRNDPIGHLKLNSDGSSNQICNLSDFCGLGDFTGQEQYLLRG
ncbi:hypothetical protein PHET_05803, partial [Paragonimus heterotremus]